MPHLDATVPLRAAPQPKQELLLDQVYREHSAAVSRWIRRLWGPRLSSSGLDEEDLLHEVFLVVQRRLATYRGEAALTTWLYGITALVVNAKRKKERWRRLLFKRAEAELDAAPVELPSAEVGRADASRVVYAVLDTLNERDRTLLISFELERLSGAELAAIVGMSEPNLWVALGRARARFRRELARRYGDDWNQGATHGEV